MAIPETTHAPRTTDFTLPPVIGAPESAKPLVVKADPAKSTYSLAGTHPVSWAVGNTLASAGKALGNHPVIALAGTIALYAGAAATGLLSDANPGAVVLGCVPWGLALVNWMTGGGIAGPLMGNGCKVLVQALNDDLCAAEIGGDEAKALGALAATEQLAARYLPTMARLSRTIG